MVEERPLRETSLSLVEQTRWSLQQEAGRCNEMARQKPIDCTRDFQVSVYG